MTVESPRPAPPQHNLHVYNELMHIACQASLRQHPQGGFEAATATANPYVFYAIDSVETANTDYPDLDFFLQAQYVGFVPKLINFAEKVIADQQPIDEATMLLGRQAVSWGWLYGKYATFPGKPLYEPVSDVEEKAEVERQYDGYHKLTEASLQRVDENMVCMAFLALRRPEIFPYPLYEYPGRLAVESVPGIHETELRGLAAVKRVVRVSGHATPLQAALLEG